MYYFFNGKYVSEGEPAASGHPRVMRGVRRSDKSSVVMKIWEKDAPEGRREADIWRAAFPDHYLEAGNGGSRFTLVRRWIPGISLEDYVEREGPLEKGKAVSVCLCAALRLRRFYQMTGMYFGDLRPSNIIIGGNSVFFVDFESAGEEKNEAGSKDNFKSRTLRFVSPGFAAPEVIRGRPCCASDFYALGVILSYLLTGEPDPGARGVDDGELKAFILKCTAEKTAERFGSIEALAAELGRILKAAGGRPLGTLEEEVLYYIGEDLAGSVDETDPGEETGLAGEYREDLLEDLSESFLNEEEDRKKEPEDAVSPFGVNFDPDEQADENEVNDARDENIQDGALLFPHYERGYRRLLLYVPGNPGFAAELGFVFGSCFGLKTCVYELCDYGTPRIRYYFTEAAETPVSKAEERSGGITSDNEYYGYSDIASEDGPVYGSKEELRKIDEEPGSSFTLQYFPENCPVEDFPILACESEDCGRVSFGAGSFEKMGFADDDFMRCFMSKAYSDYDVTILCDDMTESRENSVQLMRYCDYVLLTVGDEVDGIEAAVARYTRLLGENRISGKRLKVVCWEKNEYGAPEEILRESGGKFEFAGSISFDARRHFLKNAAGDVYCRQMNGKIIREYCDVAASLAFGERYCA